MDDMIYVWDCCGAFGFTIPWAKWHCHLIHPSRTGPAEQRIYIYSIKGQLGDKTREKGVLAREDTGWAGIINVDEFIDSNLAVDWDVVLATIKAMAREAQLGIFRDPYLKS